MRTDRPSRPRGYRCSVTGVGKPMLRSRRRLQGAIDVMREARLGVKCEMGLEWYGMYARSSFRCRAYR
ncbi:hypothetical protein KC354_g56 [Hortaea werneckii]|nr:hypothetical protein KC354_g56 [Hortaea werneckii]